MLIMRRRAGETILIGDDIRIHITAIGRTRTKLAIEAPRRLAIIAQEVQLTAEQNAAAAVNTTAEIERFASQLTNAMKDLPQKERCPTDEEFRPDPTDN